MVGNESYFTSTIITIIITFIVVVTKQLPEGLRLVASDRRGMHPHHHVHVNGEASITQQQLIFIFRFSQYGNVIGNYSSIYIYI